MNVRAKKHLGQHFLINEDVAFDIVNAMLAIPNLTNVLEIGPGMGVLSKYLINKTNYKAIEIDRESIEYLRVNIPDMDVIEGDFLQIDTTALFANNFAVIGNFPYNLSSQILFKVLENKDYIPCVVGMFQKEVAERIASKPGNKIYGILSVLLQAYYNIEYLFTVDEYNFSPPPKVKSGVIRLQRNDVAHLDCDEKLFFKVVKTAFNQRRKTLRNALSVLFNKNNMNDEIFDKRAEQLSVADYQQLTKKLASTSTNIL